MIRYAHPMLAALLASTLLLVQSAVPWMHVGCLHDHSSRAAADHSHAGCSHHHHHDDAADDDGRTSIEHTHAGGPHDCPACRYVLLSSHIDAQSDKLACELLFERQVPATPIVVASRTLGLYLSRGPPSLS